MASTTCWRCLSRAADYNSSLLRSHPATSLTAVPFAPFTTSARVQATATKGKGRGPPTVAGRHPNQGTVHAGREKNKDNSGIKGRPPAPGERKALRKRIVLSNVNALEVHDMQDLTPEAMIDTRLRGHVIGIPGPVVDQLRALEAFKASQGWGLFRRPGMLVRRETVEYGKMFEELSGESSEKVVRRVLVGEKGSGKSMMVLQAMSMALLKGWIVINIPDAMDLTMGHTEYGPLPDTQPTQYIQKTYTASLLSQIARANAPILSQLQLSQTHTLPIPLQSNISLERLAELGARDPDIAWPVFQALWTELTTRATTDVKRPPIMMAIDGLSHAMKQTAYMSADFKPIHAHDLALVQHWKSYLSGTASLPNGGLVLAAVSESNQPRVPSLDLALSQLEARGKDMEIPTGDPFMAYDPRVLESVKGMEVQRLHGLTKDETRGLMEYYARSGVLRQTVSDSLVSEKWTIAGGGVVGELERATIRMRM